jgi:hypothetical protein
VLRTYRSAMGDLDGDGAAEIVVTADSHDGVAPPSHVLWNDGTGNFTLAVLPFLGGNNLNASAVKLNDVNGDGTVDIVVGTTNSDVPNQGFGIQLIAVGANRTLVPFAGMIQVPDADIHDIAIGDVNGDGLADIVGAVNARPDDDLSDVLLLGTAE